MTTSTDRTAEFLEVDGKTMRNSLKAETGTSTQPRLREPRNGNDAEDAGRRSQPSAERRHFRVLGQHRPAGAAAGRCYGMKGISAPVLQSWLGHLVRRLERAVRGVGRQA